MKEPKNLILEEIPDKGIRVFLYGLHEQDIPLYYSRRRNIPNKNNVLSYMNITVFLAPTKEQGQYIDHRILNLYDDLSPDLKNFAEEIFANNTTLGAVSVLREMLSQHDAEETAVFLKNGLKNTTLNNFIHLEVKAGYTESDAYIEIYTFYMKGELRSYGCSVVHDIGEGLDLLYDESADYNAALRFFRKSLHGSDRLLFDKLIKQNSQM